jgi:hypothetical protein
MCGLSPTSTRSAQKRGYPGKPLFLRQKTALIAADRRPGMNDAATASGILESLMRGKDLGSGPGMDLRFAWRGLENPSRKPQDRELNPAEVYHRLGVDLSGCMVYRDSRIRVGKSLRAVVVSPRIGESP